MLPSHRKLSGDIFVNVRSARGTTLHAGCHRDRASGEKGELREKLSPGLRLKKELEPANCLVDRFAQMAADSERF